METAEIRRILAAQRKYFSEGHTLPVAARREMLKTLYAALASREKELTAALAADLGKGCFESYMCEIGMVKSEITYLLRHLRRFVAPTRVKTPLAQFPARSYTLPCPRGTVLVMSPWNYPLLLCLDPVVDALAAGNTVVLKPSAYAPATAEAVRALLADCFPEELVAVVTGGRTENRALLQEKFDLVFFTGSTAVGREVLRHTAEHLTPAILELGGKSPCIVDETADLALAARRIVFGKFLNCGQTCVAPDYVLCHACIKDELAKHLKAEILRQYGDRPLDAPDYGRIINEKHFDRLLSLIDPQKLAHGGEHRRETLQIAPTLLLSVTEEDAVMGEEIFGPLLPVLTYQTEEELLRIIGGHGKPLALYLFTKDRKRMKKLTACVPFGGGCINDVIVHLATCEMGFGGVGESGMGAYHGKTGFEAFSHRKSIVKKGFFLDLPMRYRPYRKKWEGLLRHFLK